jgi:prephenate dehydratase
MAQLRVGYLGPEGSFSHEAVATIDDVDAVACESLTDLLGAVADGSLDQGLVPLENAIEGTVSATIDGLVFDHELMIEREIVIPIRLHLLARPGVALGDVTKVRSYVHALAQCRRFLHSLDATVEQTTSTSQAAREVAESDQPWAAVASSLAGELFGLVSLASDIEDHPGNATRFVLVGRDVVAAPTGHDRTTIVCFQDADRPGSLYDSPRETSTSPSSRAGRPSVVSATTASSSSSRATSPTTWSPTASPTSKHTWLG